MAFTVTAQQTAATSNGMALYLAVVTGASGTQPGTVGATQAATNLSIDPADTGSWIYGAQVFSGTGAVTPETGTTYKQSVTGGGLRLAALRTTSTQAGGTPITMGSTNGTALDLALAEIAPSGTLAEDASSPGGTGLVAATSATTSSFTPPGSSLLVLMVSTNGGTGTTTISVSDTSGLGLTWTEQEKSNGSSKGYAGVWTAAVPASGQTVSGSTPPNLALAAPAGSVDADAAISGSTPPNLALAAPAGSVSAGIIVSGPPAALTLAAPAGTPQTSAVTVSGPAAALTLAAPAGGVTAAAAGTGTGSCPPVAALHAAGAI